MSLRSRVCCSLNSRGDLARAITRTRITSQPFRIRSAGHVSHSNRSRTRLRRSFVGHYCNARSWVPWNSGAPYEGESANYLHILARGSTHLPYAQPRFGTHCAANDPELARSRSSRGKSMSMMGDDSGLMSLTPHEEREHDDTVD